MGEPEHHLQQARLVTAQQLLDFRSEEDRDD
jgi:hypothetical protein